MRRFGEPPRPDVNYTDRAGAYAIIQRGRDLLITEQAEPFCEFQLPGGGIDPGESAIAALHREVREETGWSISITRKLGMFHTYIFMPDYDLMAHKICHIFLCRAVMQKSAPTEPQHTAVWMNPETAANMVANEGDRAFLRALF